MLTPAYMIMSLKHKSQIDIYRNKKCNTIDTVKRYIRQFADAIHNNKQTRFTVFNNVICDVMFSQNIIIKISKSYNYKQLVLNKIIYDHLGTKECWILYNDNVIISVNILFLEFQQSTQFKL